MRCCGEIVGKRGNMAALKFVVLALFLKLCDRGTIRRRVFQKGVGLVDVALETAGEHLVPDLTGVWF